MMNFTLPKLKNAFTEKDKNATINMMLIIIPERL
jgi:hypothetical protein